MAQVRVYFAFRSPYSRFGLQRIARSGLDVELWPFTGPPEGNTFRDPTQSPAVIDYVRGDVLRTALRLKLPLSMPDPFQIEFEPANRAFLAARREGKGLDFAVAASEARWGRGEDISKQGVLRAIAEEVGVDPDAVQAAQTDESIGKELLESRQWIERDKVFGVPFFVITEGEREGWRYWGQDRVVELVEDLGAA